jgi:hypothetical protein
MFDLKYRPNPPAPPAEAPETRRRPVRRASACAAAVLLAFAGAANADNLAGTHADVTGVADQIFQSDYVAADSVAAFARNGETVGTVDGSDADPLADGGSSSDIFEPADLRGQELSNTIGALAGGGNGNSGSGNARKTAGKKPAPSLTFWEDAAASDADYAGVSPESAAALAAAVAAGAGPANVLIPLPAAAWSALSVMGGVGALAGFRKIRRRLK